MAIVNAPLLSLGARGKIANTLVATSWKGLKIMRSYVKPANPRTEDQVAHRTLFSTCVNAYRTYITESIVRAGWNREALQDSDPKSGFNSAMAGLLGRLGDDPDASFVTNVESPPSGDVKWLMKNMDDGTTGDETGDFDLWMGDSPASLLFEESVPILGGLLSTTIGYTQDATKYVQVRKDNVKRSGIDKVTIGSD